MAAADDAARQTSVPARGGETVTPHDTTTLARVSRGLWVGVGGNVACLMAGGQTLTFVGVPSGTLLPIAVQRVNSTDTTATTMVAIY